MGSKCRKYYC
ncbi:hypothetical protein Patl1_26721 [Pistacia atlantica]|uniref:Uncharacterized protein n=1 Tax=Pistacia atlantica TaxID=434234 RepID=A0ACC1B338_9ROSI|nr:hypothetical protein Patl1_26721 [Pistacia atlantica]